MPSLQAQVLSKWMWLCCKGPLRSRQDCVERSRKSRKNWQPPAKFYKKFNVTQWNSSGSKVFEIAPKSNVELRARILYIHGGAHMYEIHRLHWRFIAMLAETLRAVVTVPLYPLAPEHKMEDMHNMLQPLYEEMASDHDSPFWVVGDSAGANMALAVSQQAIKRHQIRADKLVLISPCVDATFENIDAQKMETSDPLCIMSEVQEVAELVRGDWELDDPRVSPLFGDVATLPPMLILTAEKDALTPDTEVFFDKAQDAGVDAELVFGEGMIHVWPLIPFREGAQAANKIFSWLAGK